MTHHTKKERYLRANLAFILAWLRAMGYIVKKGDLVKSRSKKSKNHSRKRPSRKQLAARRKFAASAKRHHGKVPKKR